MDTFDNMFSRKSLRSFTGKAVNKDDLDTIMRMTDTAPVGRALYEDLHITIIEDKKLLKAIDENAARAFGDPNRNPLYNAPTLILVSAKNEDGPVGNVQFSNAAIVVHTMALAAVDLGIGHCDIWGAVKFLNDDLIARLELPDGFVPCCGLVLGQSNENYSKRNFPKDRISKNYIG